MIGRVSSILDPLITTAALVGAGLAGYLDSTLMSGFSATLLGVHFGPVDTILTGAGVIALAGAIFAMVSLRGARPSPQQPPAAGTTQPPAAVELLPLAAEAEQPVIGGEMVRYSATQGKNPRRFLCGRGSARNV
jgi:hypothetical protein